MHLAGKTDEARADLARLAIIRKQREDAAKKRDEEKKGRYIIWEEIGSCSDGLVQDYSISSASSLEILSQRYMV